MNENFCREIKSCRICGNTDLMPVLDLGHQHLTGHFPNSRSEKVGQGPLELVKCEERDHGKSCGLVQLRHSYNLNQMYGMNYGYRSGLNISMIQHLHSLAKRSFQMVEPSQGDLILDIGSNDGTLLRGYPPCGMTLVGMDPTGAKFRKYYRPDVHVIENFFSAAAFRKEFGGKKAKIISSIAMFYDLECPAQFVEEIFETLADDGVWVFEQSYLPSMLEMNAYDTICHEHLEYYGMRQVKWLMDRANLKILDVSLSDVNGGSFCITAAKNCAPYQECTVKVSDLLNEEISKGLDSIQCYEMFRERVLIHRASLIEFIDKCTEQDMKLLGYGASTKGNVILQFCGIDSTRIPFIAEINEDKFGRFTPGTLIPIVSEDQAKKMSPDCFLVLPWHFKTGILKREKQFLDAGGHLIFPLPYIHVT